MNNLLSCSKSSYVLSSGDLQAKRKALRAEYRRLEDGIDN